MKKTIVISIIIFWLVMMGLLMSREILPGIRRALLADDLGAGYRSILEETRWEVTRRYGIYYDEERLGDTVTIIRPREGSWTIANNISLDRSLPASLLGPFGGEGIARAIGGMRAHTRVLVDDEFRLVSLTGWVRRYPSMDTLASIDGRAVGNTLVVTLTDPAEQTYTREIPLDAENILAGGPGGLMNFPEPYIGRRWRARVLHPLTMQVETSHSEVVALETITLEGEETEAYRVETDWAGMKMISYINRMGELLIQETPVGIRLVRERLLEEDMEGLEMPDFDEGEITIPSEEVEADNDD